MKKNQFANGSQPQVKLKIYFSDFFQVERLSLEQHGALNISLINDLPLFIDPFLLFNSKKPEYQTLHQEILKYVRFLKDMSQAEGLSPGLLKAWFYFPEVKQNWLGYSKVGNGGAGLGSDFAQALNNSLRVVFSNFGEETITRSSHLEKLCLIREGIGRDKLGDFVANLIKGYLAHYTQDFTLKHLKPNQRQRVRIDKVIFNYETQTWESAEFDLPWIGGDYVLLTPKDILTKDDAWINRGDFLERFPTIIAAVPNSQLRDQVNQYFLRQLPRRPSAKEKMKAAVNTVEQFPQVVDYYIRSQENRAEEAKSVSQEKVNSSEQIYIKQLPELVQSLQEVGFYSAPPPDTYTAALTRVNYLKQVVENNNGYRVFYIDGKPIQREADVHIMFRLTWFATPYDVNAEVDNGGGPVDYKISLGSADTTLVEFKLASNSHLKANLVHQVAAYAAANQTKQSIKVIFYFSTKQLNRVKKILRELRRDNDTSIVLIDASNENRVSASKIR